MKIKFSKTFEKQLLSEGYRITGEFREPKLNELYWTNSGVSKCLDERIVSPSFIIARGGAIVFPSWVDNNVHWVTRNLLGEVELFEKEPEVSGRFWACKEGLSLCLQVGGIIDVSWVPPNPKKQWELAKWTRVIK